MIRKTPPKVTILDFTRMYPTMTMLLEIWEFIPPKVSIFMMFAKKFGN